MKKLNKVLAALMLIGCLTLGLSMTVLAACHGNASYDSIVNGETLTIACDEGVNLRSYPSTTQGKVYTAMPVGSQVFVMKKEIGIKGWLYVTYGDISGYCYTVGDHGNFFSHGQSTVTEYDLTQDPNYRYEAKVTTSSLYVRNGYYITKPIIGSLSYGQVVEAIANTSNGWIKVRYYSGSTQIVGYISGNYAKLNKIKVTPDPVPDPINDDTSFNKMVGCVAESVNENDLTIYASPKTYAGVLAKLDEADMVYITAKAANNMWYQINFYDSDDDEGDVLLQTGYVKASDVYVYRVFDKLKLSATKATIKVGDKKKLKVVDRYRFFSDVRMFGVTTTFHSTNRKVAIASKTGVIKAKKKGTATIKVRVKIGSGAYKRTRLLTCDITVK